MNEDKASRYHRLKRWSHIASLGWTLVLLVGLLASGESIALRDAAGRLAASIAGKGLHAGATVVVFVGFLLLLNEVGTFPLSFYSGFLLEHRYGLSNERAGRWLVDQMKSFALGFVLSSGEIGR